LYVVGWKGEERRRQIGGEYGAWWEPGWKMLSLSGGIYYFLIPLGCWLYPHDFWATEMRGATDWSFILVWEWEWRTVDPAGLAKEVGCSGLCAVITAAELWLSHSGCPRSWHRRSMPACKRFTHHSKTSWEPTTCETLDGTKKTQNSFVLRRACV
jgi:hypothetical protein